MWYSPKPLVLPPGLPEGSIALLPGRGEVFYRHHRGDPSLPTLLLLHGWTASADLQWFTAYEQLAERYSFVAVDHRGHGRGLRSDEPFRSRTWPTMPPPSSSNSASAPSSPSGTRWEGRCRYCWPGRIRSWSPASCWRRRLSSGGPTGRRPTVLAGPRSSGGVPPVEGGRAGSGARAVRRLANCNPDIEPYLGLDPGRGAPGRPGRPRRRRAGAVSLRRPARSPRPSTGPCSRRDHHARPRGPRGQAADAGRRRRRPSASSSTATTSASGRTPRSSPRSPGAPSTTSSAAWRRHRRWADPHPGVGEPSIALATRSTRSSRSAVVTTSDRARRMLAISRARNSVSAWIRAARSRSRSVWARSRSSWRFWASRISGAA